MNWNHDIDAAPRNGFVWLYTQCGKITKSYWLASGRWCMLSANERPLAWREYDKDEFAPVKIGKELTWPNGKKPDAPRMEYTK